MSAWLKKHLTHELSAHLDYLESFVLGINQ